ncbi:uncharacterized protein LOC143219857 [Lasioglossum baleicum]|uniref:uncharacterized protein LOC143219857 n=1 Tax=Lasioglossum baleicum TaxID=434251 RepID=UPI003FCED3D8
MEDENKGNVEDLAESSEDGVMIVEDFNEKVIREGNKRQRRDSEIKEVQDLKKKLGELGGVMRKTLFFATSVKAYCKKNKCISKDVTDESTMVVSTLQKALSLLEEAGNLTVDRLEKVKAESKKTQVTPSLKGRHESRVFANNSTQCREGTSQRETQDEPWRNEKERKEQARREKEEKRRLELEEKRRKLEIEKKEREARRQLNPPPPRPEAILIKTTVGRTFADLFRELKTNTGDKMAGIQTVRKSRGGDLLIELQKDMKSCEFEKIVKDSLGASQQTRRLVQRVIYEIKDIDPTLEKEELREELAAKLQIGKEEVEIRNKRFGFGGTSTIIVALPKAIGEKVLEDRRIRLGYTSCRVKIATNIVRCFKCHDFGHLTYSCPEKNSANHCRRCGQEGHSINDCQSGGSDQRMQLTWQEQLAHNLVHQTAFELGVDVVLISEPLRNPGSWVYTKDTNNAAIWVTGTRGLKNQEDGDRQEEDFVVIRVGQISIFSIYLSPNTSPERYATKLEKLESSISKERRKGRKSSRGTLTLETLLGQNIHPVIPIGGPTFERRGSSSYIDLMASSPELQRDDNFTCKVLDIESACDHRYIYTEIETEEIGNPEEERPCKWKVTPRGVQKLGRVLNRRLEEVSPTGSECWNPSQIEKMIQILPEICDEALEKTGDRRSRKENPWWTKEIGEVRRNVQKLRRLWQRANKSKKRDEADAIQVLYKLKKKELNKRILKAKEKSWSDLCDTIEKDVWGKPYKAIIRRVKGATPPPALSTSMAEAIMFSLFPQDSLEAGTSSGTRESSGGREYERTEETFQKVTIAEIQKAGKALKTGKAAGPDGMPPEAIKALIALRPDCFVAMFNGILKNGIIPEQWKRARTILLRKQGKDPATPSAYRPICIIDAAAKLLEYVLKDRILEFLGPKPFRPEQYGFCKGKSTTHAMDYLKKKMQQATRHFRTLKNAFNSLCWKKIFEEMRERRMPSYLLKVTEDYFRGRVVTYQTTEGQVRTVMRKGVPQGSVLGPLFWNLVYDGLLKRKLPPLCSRRAFADDIVIIAQGFNLQRMKKRLEDIIEDTRKWMNSAGLQLAEQKTEIMMANKKRLPEGFRFRVGAAEIPPANTLKYLGVTFDNQKIFIKHIELATNKAIKVTTALSTLMRNKMKTSQKARKLYYLTMESIVLYGAPIWGDSVGKIFTTNALRRTQRMGLARVVSAYKTVPVDTLCVLAGVPPWDLKAEERKVLFQWENLILNFQHEAGEEGGVSGDSSQGRRDSDGEEEMDYTAAEGLSLPALDSVREEWTPSGDEGGRVLRVKRELRKLVKERTLERWQTKWEEATVGRPTFQIIPNIEEWISRIHGEMDFYITQALTGHGVFNTFRFRIGKAVNAACWYHPEEDDDPEHTITKCDKWTDERRRLVEKMRIEEGELTMRRIVKEMLNSEPKWNAARGFFKSILIKKEEEERKREKCTGEEEEGGLFEMKE